MHQALKTPEIVRDIFTHLGPTVELDHSKNPTKSLPEDTGLFDVDSETLLNSALTCRSFLEPSLDALWGAMNTLTPLFCLIPGFDSSSLSIAGAHSKSDFDAFIRYADRIQHCHIIFSDTDNIPLSIYVAVSQIVQRTAVLRNLKTLVIDFEVLDLPFFFCQGLRTLRVRQRSTDHTLLSSVLATLSFCSPGLRSLILEDEDDKIPAESWVAVSRLTALNHLSVPNSLYVGYDFVTKFPFVSGLVELHIASLTFQVPLRSTADLSFFPNLKILHVSTAKILQIVILLSMDPLPKLESLSFELIQEAEYSETDEEQWLQLFRLLVVNNPQTFRRLHVAAPDLDTKGWTRPGMKLTTAFFNLFRLPLTQLRIQFPLIKSISTDTLQPIFDSWPALTHLEIMTRDKAPIKPPHLLSIASSLPKLEVLCIGIDGKTNPSLEDVQILSHRLRWLILANSRNCSSLTFACYLDKLFPFVKVLRGDCIRALDEDAFGKVNKHIAVLQTARKDERIRMCSV